MNSECIPSSWLTNGELNFVEEVDNLNFDLPSSSNNPYNILTPVSTKTFIHNNNAVNSTTTNSNGINNHNNINNNNIPNHNTINNHNSHHVNNVNHVTSLNNNNHNANNMSNINNMSNNSHNVSNINNNFGNIGMSNVKSINSPQHFMSASSPNNGLCAICSDKATGKHYGASSCDGCKGFFRRSVRKNHVYQCRFVRSCHVDKDKRNQCRYCRLKKCFRAGMKKEAVQNERDRISVRRTPYDDQQRNSALSVATLYNADAATKSMLTQITTSDITRKALANVGDICESMKQQVMKMIDWAKLIPPFNEMDTDDKVSLLRSHACEHLLLSLARRSCMYNDTLLLSNDTVITRTSLDNEQNKITCRIMDELIQPMRDIQMDESEFACLLAIILFDPSSRNLTISHRIRSLRWQVQVNLEDYINDRQYDSRGRFGEMLLLLQNLQTIAFQVIEQINAYRLYAGLKLDTLLLEMILQEYDERQPTGSVYLTPPPSAHLYNQQTTHEHNSPPFDVHSNVCWSNIGSL